MGWWRSIRRWIKRIFGGKKAQLRPTIIKAWYNKSHDCGVFQIQRSTPGEIATYRITSQYGSYDYLLALDNLRELQTEVAGEFNGTTFKLRHRPNPYIPHLTHRFSVWRVYRSGRSDAIGVWDVDLQGFARANLGAIAPQRAVRGVALQCLKITHSTKTPDLNWQAQGDRMDWLGLLEEKIRGELQNPRHSLRESTILVANKKALREAPRL